MNNVLSLKTLALGKINYSCFLAKIQPVLIILIIFFAIAYVFQINFEIAERYAIRQYETELAHTLNEKNSLEKTYLQKSSLAEITPFLEEMNFQSLGKIKYINVADHQVVVR